LFIKSITEFSVFIDKRETRRVDLFLSTLFPDKSRSYIQKLLQNEDVFVRGEAIKKNTKIYRGDEIKILWRVDSKKFEAEDIPLDIVYDSAGFAVINKDPGMNVHPVPGEG
jgi:23S rRNA pseudouridine1911/1915/1917 synthase